MNYKYMKEKNIKETILSYILSIILLLFAIIGNTKSPINQAENAFDLFSIKWWISISGVILIDIFIIYCGKILDTERKNYKKWISYLVENGVKCNGYVTEITYVKKDTYKLKICYYSELQKKDIDFYASNIIIKTLDKNKKILCDVYEISEQHKISDYDAEVIRVDENRIDFNINPIKLFKVVRRKYQRKWFVNIVAVDFHYEN